MNISKKRTLTYHNIRELRNQIAHEYVINDLNELFADVLRFIPELERLFGNVKSYIKNSLKDTPPQHGGCLTQIAQKS